jgi:MoaA/NifB/PqqE/SkfB family radical SAM enzyme
LPVFEYAGIRRVHLEVTARCNLACPQCARNDSRGRDHPLLPISELTLDDVKSIFPAELLARLDALYLCGNYGDPMVARDTVEIFEHLRAQNRGLELTMITNGSGRTADWWQALARLGVRVRFSIDGLADTNHLYRRHSSFSTILESVGAFIGAGGHAIWDFIVFRHNEHQVEEARRLSRELGFRELCIKRTARFIHGPVDDLEPPLNPAYRNGAVDVTRERIVSGRYDRHLETLKIRCKALEAREIYVSAEGLVFPCCFTAQLYSEQPRSLALMRLLEAHGGKAAIDGRRGLSEIVEGPFFRAIAESWNGNRILTCAHFCGDTPENLFLAANQLTD